MEGKFFPFRVDPFSGGHENNFDRVTFPENKSVPINNTNMIDTKDTRMTV